jgi:hypothetical protein
MTALRDFLEIPYDELEALNLAAKEQRQNRVSLDTLREERMKYLTEEKRIKAVLSASPTLKAACTCWIMTRNSCSSRWIT